MRLDICSLKYKEHLYVMKAFQRHHSCQWLYVYSKQDDQFVRLFMSTLQICLWNCSIPFCAAYMHQILQLFTISQAMAQRNY